MVELLDIARFQYGVRGPLFTKPPGFVGIITGYYFRERWIGAGAAAFAVAPLPLWLFFGYRVLVDGSRSAVAWYLGSSCVVCTALLIVGSQTVPANWELATHRCRNGRSVAEFAGGSAVEVEHAERATATTVTVGRSTLPAIEASNRVSEPSFSRIAGVDAEGQVSWSDPGA